MDLLLIPGFPARFRTPPTGVGPATFGQTRSGCTESCRLAVPSSVPISADQWYEYIGGICTKRSRRNIRHSGACTF